MRYNAKLFKHPALFHLGSEDTIVDNEATKKFYEKLGSKVKEMFEYEGAYHELQYEDSFKEMFKNTMDWLNARLKDKSTKKFGKFEAEKVKIKFLRKRQPFRHWKKVLVLAIFAYYIIGYVLMITKYINKNKHEMLAVWPCSVYRKLFLKK